MLSTTRLGEGILSSSRMGDVPLARTTDAIRDFASVARENGADEIFIYATAVVRESSNKDEFIRLVEDKTGITPHIIPGSLEGEIAFITAKMTEADTEAALEKLTAKGIEVKSRIRLL